MSVATECPNCDGRKCMACVLREVHDACVDDCPFCCKADNDRRAAEHLEAMVSRGTAAVQEEFDERGLGDASLLVRVILDAAQDVAA